MKLYAAFEDHNLQPTKTEHSKIMEATEKKPWEVDQQGIL
jgi:Zn/Cd-binding protein ZinT